MPLAARRVRQLPRLVVGAIVVAIVLFGIGLLIGGTVGSTHTTELRTVIATTTLTQESPVQAAQLHSASTTIAADSTAIVTLGTRLRVTRRRLARTRRELRAERRKLAAAKRKKRP